MAKRSMKYSILKSDKKKRALTRAFNKQVAGGLLGGSVKAPKTVAEGESEAVGDAAKRMKKV